MTRSNNVIVFIVEGSTDKDALYGILSELYEDRQIVFSVVDGDITTDKYTAISNIDRKIVSFVKKAMERDKFIKSNIQRIVHLVDTDGAYIPDSSIVFKDIDDPFYTPNIIETSNVDYMKKRNKQKRDILNKLSTTTTLYKGIPYSVYYMSCNLEHVLHNIQNAPKDDKKRLAEALEERFYDSPDKFVKYMNDPSFAATGTYEDTWKYIKNGINSLNRQSNFHLFFE